MQSVRFPEQGTGGPDEEAFEVTFDDGRVERFTMHDYGRVYAVPGLYEEVVQRMLGCATPDVVARMVADAATGDVRVVDLGAGNGVSGEALAAAGAAAGGRDRHRARGPQGDVARPPRPLRARADRRRRRARARRRRMRSARCDRTR